jgi:hypothetical protein
MDKPKLEIMDWFDKEIEIYSAVDDEHLHNALDKVREGLPDAVYREIVRAVKEFDDGYRSGENYFEVIKFIENKYSPKPRYCDKMQEAINNDWVRHLKQGYCLMNKEHDGMANIRKIDFCPYCKANCIGDHN